MKAKTKTRASSGVEIMGASGIEKSISPEWTVLDQVAKQSETGEVSVEWHDSPVVHRETRIAESDDPSSD